MYMLQEDLNLLCQTKHYHSFKIKFDVHVIEVNRSPWMAKYNTDFGGVRVAMTYDYVANFLVFKLPQGFPYDTNDKDQGFDQTV